MLDATDPRADEAGHDGSTSAEAPPLSTRRIRLRRIDERDHRFLQDLMTSPEAGGRVRFGGATPSPERVMASLWDSVLAQFLVEGISDSSSLGLVAITSPDFRNAFAYLSALSKPEAQGSGLVAEATLVAVNYAFTSWPFRKIYLEATDDSLQAFHRGTDRLFREEGRLVDHVFWNGRYVDMVTLAIYRSTWADLSPRLAGLLLDGPGSNEQGDGRTNGAGQR